MRQTNTTPRGFSIRSGDGSVQSIADLFPNLRTFCSQQQQDEYEKKCHQLLYLADYHGLDINLLELVSIKCCKDVYQRIYNIVLDDYERREIIRQQSEDMEEEKLFCSPDKYDSIQVDSYAKGELRLQASWSMNRELAFMPTVAFAKDPFAKLAAELER